ncbi:SURF1 family protein [Xanthobacter sp. DSM 24535]|uniref:SURF1 family protein n=1 Tax=Roseixanthobacter psychrophilus TaxID=3119917 RepID=UPI00372C2060
MTGLQDPAANMAAPEKTATPRGGRRIVLRLLAVGVCLVLVALGAWQVQRRAWKLDLIQRVDARIHASPVPAPGPAAWKSGSPAADEYLRVQASGIFLNDRQTLVKAVTERGGGYWVLTPLRTDAGFTVIVNRGFIPTDQAQAGLITETPPRQVSVTGLLRLSEPAGGFLRANDPDGGRWYSRDVPAIAEKRGLGIVAPYFIDAEATPGAPAGPVGGLTVVNFPNNHLIYALTWFGLAAMALAAAFFV